MYQTKVNFDELRGFVAASNMYIVNGDNAKTKLAYAIERTAESIEPILAKFNKERKRILVENAATDSNDCLIEKDKVNPNNPNEEVVYKYTAQGTLKKDDELEALNKRWNKELIEISVYFATELPKDLQPFFRKAFEGFVIEPVDELETV